MKRSEMLKSEFMKTAISLVILLICVGGFWLALRAALRTEFPLHAVVSESMVPTIHVGDLLVVQGVVNASEINAAPKTGDIIVFRKPGDPSEFIVHRAVDKIHRGDSWEFRTKGDNNSKEDPWVVPEDYVIGKVVSVNDHPLRIPLLGYLKIFLNPEENPVGVAVLIILILILLFADYIPMLRERSKT